jgi:ribosomal protein S6--L-glutamate ligase
MLESRSGPKILEINSSPGLEGIERATGIDVATALIDHAEKYSREQRQMTKKDLDDRILRVIQDERATPPRVMRAQARPIRTRRTAS